MTRRKAHKRPTRARKSGYTCLSGHELLRSLKRSLYCPVCDA